MDPSPEILRELSLLLIRAGYGNQQIRDEDVDRIVCIIYDKKNGLEYAHGQWKSPGKGYRYKQFQFSVYTALRLRNKNISVKLVLPTEDLILCEFDTDNPDSHQEFNKKIKEIKSFREYIKVKKVLERKITDTISE